MPSAPLQNEACMTSQNPARAHRYVGIIGYPLGHSISPALQQAAFDALDLPVTYERWEVPPEGLAERVLSIRREDILGANVTVPHKEQALMLMDEVEERAGLIGAVNTIVNRDGRLTGHNTDAPGFLRALREDGGFDPKGKLALLLGAGGAARAVAFALASAGIARLIISNRTQARAEALARDLRVRAKIDDVTVASWGAVPPKLDLIVNATSIGMTHGETAGESPLGSSSIEAGCMIADLIYGRSETPFAQAARKAGAQTLDGLPMLVYQGALAFELWTGHEAPLGVMFEAARRALRD